MGTKPLVIRRILKNFRVGSENDFIELVRSFDRACARQSATGWADSCVDETLRFGQRPSMSSSARNVAGVTELSNSSDSVFIEVYAPGLCGVDGPMPLDVTGQVISQSRNNYDYALQRFLDIVNHRFISFYYRAYAQHSTSISFDRHSLDLPRRLQRSFSGADGQGVMNLPPFAAEAFSPYTACGNIGKKSLAMILESFFGFEIKVCDRIFSKNVIPKKFRCILGRWARLGEDTQIGAHYYSNTKKFLLKIGPLDFDDCLAFMPGKKRFNQLCQLVNFCLRKPLEFDLELMVRKSSLRGITLNGSYALGSSTFFKHNDQNGHCSLTINASRLGSTDTGE